MRSAGRMVTGPVSSGGKKVDEWKFTSPGQVSAIVVEVRLIKKNSKLTFVASVDSLGQSFEGSDIEALRGQVEGALRESDNQRLGLVWCEWLEITVRGSDVKQKGDSVSLSISYKIIHRAVDESTGRAHQLVDNGGYLSVIPFPESHRYGDGIDSGAKYGFKIDDLDQEKAFVVASPDNLAAVKTLCDGLSTLRSRIADFINKSHQTGRVDLIAAKNQLISG